MNHDRWEHKVMSMGFGLALLRSRWIDQANEAMNREGAAGWQLVSAQWTGTQLTMFFKRPR